MRKNSTAQIRLIMCGYTLNYFSKNSPWFQLQLVNRHSNRYVWLELAVLSHLLFMRPNYKSLSRHAKWSVWRHREEGVYTVGRGRRDVLLLSPTAVTLKRLPAVDGARTIGISWPAQSFLPLLSHHSIQLLHSKQSTHRLIRFELDLNV